MESEPLLGPGYVLDPARYYVVSMYCLLTINQCLFWFTFSSASTIQVFILFL